jgi:hypothetical protein
MAWQQYELRGSCVFQIVSFLKLEKNLYTNLEDVVGGGGVINCEFFSVSELLEARRSFQ